jgi:hypothetical protein
MSVNRKVVVIPLIILVAAVVVGQTLVTGLLPGRLADIAQMPITYAHNRWEGLLLMLKDYMLSRSARGVQLMGYNFDKDLTQASVTLWYRGSASMTISDVALNGTSLKEGVSTLTQTGSTNDVVFASASSWNLDNGNSGSTVQPNTIIMLYLGVGSPAAGSAYVLQVTAGGQTYTFTLGT